MKRTSSLWIAGIALLVFATLLFAANPTFVSFIASQFGYNATEVWIKPGAVVTNIVDYGSFRLPGATGGVGYFAALDASGNVSSERFNPNQFSIVGASPPTLYIAEFSPLYSPVIQPNSFGLNPAATFYNAAPFAWGVYVITTNSQRASEIYEVGAAGTIMDYYLFAGHTNWYEQVDSGHWLLKDYTTGNNVILFSNGTDEAVFAGKIIGNGGLQLPGVPGGAGYFAALDANGNVSAAIPSGGGGGGGNSNYTTADTVSGLTNKPVTGPTGTTNNLGLTNVPLSSMSNGPANYWIAYDASGKPVATNWITVSALDVGGSNAPIGTVLTTIDNASGVAFRPVSQPTNYNVVSFGATGSGIVFTNAAIASASHSLSVTGGSFVIGDVGKVIEVVGAGASGLLLKTTISAWSDANDVTLLGTAGTTVTGSYGVYGYSDATVIQTAINTVCSNGGGTLYFPKGIYIVDSPVFLPPIGHTGFVAPTISFLGFNTPALMQANFAADYPFSGSNSVVWGMLTGEGGSVLSTTNQVNPFYTNANPGVGVKFNCIGVAFHKMVWVGNTNSILLDLRGAADAFVGDIMLTTGTPPYMTPLPTDTNSIGLIMPVALNGGHNWAYNPIILGFYNGVIPGELTTFNNTMIYSCSNSVYVQFSGGNGCNFYGCFFGGCKNYFYDLGLDATYALTISGDITIENVVHGNWDYPPIVVNDPHNFMSGHISVKNSDSTDTTTMTNIGATYVRMTCLSGSYPAYDNRLDAFDVYVGQTITAPRFAWDGTVGSAGFIGFGQYITNGAGESPIFASSVGNYQDINNATNYQGNKLVGPVVGSYLVATNAVGPQIILSTFSTTPADMELRLTASNYLSATSPYFDLIQDTYPGAGAGAEDGRIRLTWSTNGTLRSDIWYFIPSSQLFGFNYDVTMMSNLNVTERLQSGSIILGSSGGGITNQTVAAGKLVSTDSNNKEVGIIDTNTLIVNGGSGASLINITAGNVVGIITNLFNSGPGSNNVDRLGAINATFGTLNAPASGLTGTLPYAALPSGVLTNNDVNTRRFGGVLLSSNLFIPTNAAALGPDVLTTMGTYVASGSVAITAPVNVMGTNYFSYTMSVTNNTGTPVAITYPSGWHPAPGAVFYCTNQTDVLIMGQVGKWTNISTICWQ